MKKRSLSGNVGIGIFLVAFLCIFIAFGTPAWLESDYRIIGSQFKRLGLWSHCFNSLPNPREEHAPRRFFVGCRWIYDPFTTGYSDIRAFLLPPFMVATQFFFTICFLLGLVSLALIGLYSLCCDPEQKRYVQLITIVGCMILVGGLNGGLAVIIFACLGNADGWMRGHANNYLGWSFGMAVVGCILMLIASGLFFVDADIQRKKRKYITDSQTRFQVGPHA